MTTITFFIVEMFLFISVLDLYAYCGCKLHVLLFGPSKHLYLRFHPELRNPKWHKDRIKINYCQIEKVKVYLRYL